MSEEFATTSIVVDNYIESMKKVLKGKKYGKVGIIFKIHQGFVVGVEEVRETIYKVVDKNSD